MNNTKRRIVLGLGAALLVGGWGVMQFVKEKQQSTTTRADRREFVWHGGDDEILSSRIMFTSSIVSMTIGAGLIAFSLIKTKESKDEND